MPEVPVTTSPELVKQSTGPLRDEFGRLLPGQASLNPNGRPRGSISIRDSIRLYLEDNPPELIKVIKHFVEINPEFMWSMLETAPPKGMVVANPDGSALNGPSLAVLEMANKLNEIHSPASIGSDGSNALIVGDQTRDQNI